MYKELRCSYRSKFPAGNISIHRFNTLSLALSPIQVNQVEEFKLLSLGADNASSIPNQTDLRLQIEDNILPARRPHLSSNPTHNIVILVVRALHGQRRRRLCVTNLAYDASAAQKRCQKLTSRPPLLDPPK